MGFRDLRGKLAMTDQEEKMASQALRVQQDPRVSRDLLDSLETLEEMVEKGK